MSDILKQVDKLEEKNNVISLWEIEKAFDNIAKNPEDQKALVNALDKLLSDKLSDKKTKYDLWFEYSAKIKEIANTPIDLSKIDEKTIKVYQLCKNLELKRQWHGDQYIEINGKIWPEIISDRIGFYTTQGIGLLSGSESLNYNKATNEILLKTQFGEIKKSLQESNSIIDNIVSCRTFVDDTRKVLFGNFLINNKIISQEWEEISLSQNKVITVHYKNNKEYIDKSFSLDISAWINNENILKFFQEKRSEYKGMVAERGEYISTIGEIDKGNKASLSDSYKNINLLMWDDEYTIFSNQKFYLRDVTATNIWKLEINKEGNLLIGYKNKPILNYDFNTLSVDKRQKVLVNISNILKDFVNYYPDYTKRQTKGAIVDIQRNINQEKWVLTLYTNLIKKENVAKLINGTLDLKSFSSKYRDKAFAYMMAEMKKNGQDVSEMVKKRSMNSPLFTFVDSRKNSLKETDVWYKKLYYAFIKNKLWDAMKVDNAGTKTESRSLDETKINVLPSATYEWLMCQKWAWGDDLKAEEANKKMVELTTKNKRLQWLTQEQQDILLKTDMGKGLLKSAIYKVEQKKYKEATSAFSHIDEKYKDAVWDVYSAINEANKWLNGTAYQSIGGDRYKWFSKNYPQYAKYIRYNENKIMTGWRVWWFELNRDVAEKNVFRLRQPFEETWVQHMKDIDKVWLTKYIEWTVPGQKGKVNMSEVIKSGKTIDSPYSDWYCKSKMNFSNGTPSEIVRDTNREGIKDRFNNKWDAIEDDPLNGIASTVIDVWWIVVWWVVAWVVGVLPMFPPGSAALAFTLVDNAVKTVGYSTLEGINYLAWTGEYKEVKDKSFSWFFNATITWWEEWLNILKKETDVYGKISRVKDAAGNVVTKDASVIMTEKGLELASSFILFGPVGKVGQMVEKSVFNEMVMNNLEKEFWEKAMSKLFTDEVSKLGSKEVGSMFGKDIVTGGVKVGSKATWFMAEVSTFTAYNAISASPSSFLVTLAETHDISKAQAAAESSWAESFSLKGLTTSFIHNVWFIGLLKWSNLLAEPISSKIMSGLEKTMYLQSRSDSESLWVKLDAQMKKDWVNFFTKDEIAANKDIKVDNAEVEKLPPWEEWWFFQKTAEWGYKYVDPTEIPKVTEINNQITTLKAKVASLMQSLASKTEKVKDMEGIKNFSDFVIKNNLDGMAVTPEIILQKRIEYCENKIKTAEWTEKIKYEKVLETLNAQKTELVTLREWYTKSLDLINVDEKGNLTIIKQDEMNDDIIRTEDKTEEVKNDIITDPKELLAMPEEEMKTVLEKEVNGIKEELKNINSETTAEQKLAIIKKVEIFFNKIKDMLSDIKEHYQTVKWMKWLNRVDYLINLVDELWLHEKIMDKDLRKMMKPSAEDIVPVVLKGLIETYRTIRYHYDDIKLMDKTPEGSDITTSKTEDGEPKSPVNPETVKTNEIENTTTSLESQAEIQEMNNLIADKEVNILINEDRATLENEIKANPSKLDAIIQKFSSILEKIEKIKKLPHKLMEEIMEIKSFDMFMHKAKEFFEFLHKLEHLTHPEWSNAISKIEPIIVMMDGYIHTSEVVTEKATVLSEKTKAQNGIVSTTEDAKNTSIADQFEVKSDMTIEEIRQDIQSKKAILNERIHNNTMKSAKDKDMSVGEKSFLDMNITLAKKQIASLEKLEAHFNRWEEVKAELESKKQAYEDTKPIREKIEEIQKKWIKLKEKSAVSLLLENVVQKINKKIGGSKATTQEGIWTSNKKIIDDAQADKLLSQDVLSKSETQQLKEYGNTKLQEVRKITKEMADLKTDLVSKAADIYIGMRDIKEYKNEPLKLFEFFKKHLEFFGVGDSIDLSKTFKASRSKIMESGNFERSKEDFDKIISWLEKQGKLDSKEWTKSAEAKNAIDSKMITDILTSKLKGEKGSLSATEADKAITDFIQTVKEPAQQAMLQELWQSLKVDIDDNTVLPEKKAIALLYNAKYLSDYMNSSFAEGKSPTDVYLLMEANQNKLIHQHVQDKWYLTGSSHDILHILEGNTFMAEHFFDNMSIDERVLVRQIMLDHDLGYTSEFNRALQEKMWKEWSTQYFAATKDHPLWSAVAMEKNKARYVQYFWWGEKGEANYQKMKECVIDHSDGKSRTQDLPQSTPVEGKEINRSAINSVVSLTDCIAASADYKSAFLFAQPELVKSFIDLYVAVHNEKSLKNIEDIMLIMHTQINTAPPDLQPSLNEAFEGMFGQVDATLHDTKIDPSEKIKALQNSLKTPFEKYLAQYGTRLRQLESGKVDIGSNNGVITAGFELAGRTFFDLAKKTGNALLFLGSFAKAIDDMNVDVHWPEYTNFQNKIQEIFTASTSYEDFISNLQWPNGFGWEYTTLTGAHGEKFNFYFRGKEYEWVTEVMKSSERIERIKQSSKKELQEILKDDETLSPLEFKSQKSSIISIIDNFMTNGGIFPYEKMIRVRSEIAKMNIGSKETAVPLSMIETIKKNVEELQNILDNPIGFTPAFNQSTK